MNCHECTAPVPDSAKRCLLFDYPFCDPCWDKLLPPDPEDYYRMMDEALKSPTTSPSRSNPNDMKTYSEDELC